MVMLQELEHLPNTFNYIQKPPQCPLSGVKRTSHRYALMSAFDPKRPWPNLTYSKFPDRRFQPPSIEVPSGQTEASYLVRVFLWLIDHNQFNDLVSEH